MGGGQSINTSNSQKLNAVGNADENKIDLVQIVYLLFKPLVLKGTHLKFALFSLMWVIGSYNFKSSASGLNLTSDEESLF